MEFDQWVCQLRHCFIKIEIMPDPLGANVKMSELETFTNMVH